MVNYKSDLEDNSRRQRYYLGVWSILGELVNYISDFARFPWKSPNSKILSRPAQATRKLSIERKGSSSTKKTPDERLVVRGFAGTLPLIDEGGGCALLRSSLWMTRIDTAVLNPDHLDR